MADTITIHDKQFEPYISAEQVAARISELAVQIDSDLHNKCPLFLAVLNGAFFFAADLLRELNFSCEISFVKITSYEGISSSGAAKTLLGLDENIAGRHVVIIEDIVDTGLTMHSLLHDLHTKKPESVRIAALLCKREAMKFDIHIDYPGFEVTNEFLVGYGLDYDRQGRNYPGILKIKS